MQSEHACYHCGLSVPTGTQFAVDIGGAQREMCCAGCQAVAQAIVDNGLADYYRHRDALPERPREALPAVLRELTLYDHPDVQQGFVRPLSEHEREASLILEGITCAACVWLNEQHLTRQAGVTAVEINYATRRARVRWDERRIRLSGILAAIAAIGYAAHPYDAARAEEVAGRERRAALWRLFVAGFGMMQVMMYAVPVYLAGEGEMSADVELLMRWASLVLTLPVVLYSAAPFFRNAWRDLRLKRVGMDVPVALGVGAAFLASLWATLVGAGEVYFDSVTMFVFLLLGGRYLEMLARHKSVRAIERVGRALPAFADRLLAYPALETERVVVSELAPGDRVLLAPGQAVPADGEVVQGESEVDESLLTGESRPVAKQAGSALTGGTINIRSPLVLQVRQVGEATRLASIVRLMERALTEKPRVVQLADRVAAGFVAALLVLAAVTGIAWSQIDPSRALWVFISVLVVSCPCALSLATPTALAVATGAFSRLGLLVARGHAIETLARADHFVFDKTGTLTWGRLRLKQTLPLAGMDASDALQLAAALEQGSEHAIGVALRAACPQKATLGAPQDLQSHTGQGVEASIAGRRCRLGRPAFVAALHGQPVPAAAQALLQTGDTCVALADASGWLAFFSCGDEVREDAAELVRGLKASGCRVSLLSGDAPEAVRQVAARLGIEAAHGGMTPQDKHDHLVALQAAGAIVAMVGDGVNDAPVLAQAQVSVAMGGGTELARNQADIVLLGDQIGRLLDGVHLARRTQRIVRQNLGWAFAYNVSAIPLAMLGWITPWMAGVGMSASSLLVVVNALRLLPRDMR
ncbi:MAG: heavy metal translocating P-type ATPase [Betaproteobacteria bacterium]|nr:heavy metal translocating P-type ATPase [Betaproteobacteria bacterium]MBM4182381.1 heavy metal translocating P-type ATPase [Betaproteobacteria bacterium]